MTKTMRERIVERWGATTLRKSALNIRGGAGVFEQMLSGKGFDTVLEIGTYKGCSSAEMSLYCKQVITIDLVFGKLEQNGSKWDRYAFWESLGITNVHLMTVRDNAEKATIVSTLQFDFAFIDGAHDRSVADDFAMVKKCGHVLFHDADDNGPGVSNCVHEFIKTLPQDEVEFVDIFAMWTAK